MKKATLLIIGMILSSFFFMSSRVAIAQEDEEVWDFTGVMNQSSDDYRGLIIDPEDPEVGNYTKPKVYMQILGFDTNEDVEMDTYYGFWGVSTFDLSHYDYFVITNLYRIILNAKWSLRIPESSSLHWEVLYYPDPLYNDIKNNLLHNIPVYYVNLTKSLGCNLEFRLDFGLNYTIGNFTTFGDGMPLVPSLPSFPGYNASIPLFTANLPIAELVETAFFDSPAGFISVIVVISMFSYYRMKRGKKTKQR